MSDVIIIGGGVIGLTSACELAGEGLSVTLLDQQQPGREASWAGAGILPPGHPGRSDAPLAQLCGATHALWPKMSEQLLGETGIDNGFCTCGGLCFSPDADEQSLQAEIADWQAAQVMVETPTRQQLQSCEPALGNATGPGYRLPDTCQVRNPRHLKALLAACHRRGVDIRPGQTAVEIESVQDRATAVRTTTDRFEGGTILLTAGPWSQRFLESANCPRKVEPVRGQMLLLSTPAPLFEHVIECGPRYLVPRRDGRTLIGSTEEWAGFEKANTPAAMRSLMDFALRMVPSLARARFEQAWSGLRPHAVDGRPIIGQLGSLQNLFVATGHFRGGLHLSPITGRLVRQLITGAQTEIDLSAFSPQAGPEHD